MLQNWSPGDPPIIIACQTNHALDQLLRHVSEFEESFARLGGRSKDTGLIRERTLYQLRQGKKIHLQGGMRGPARTAMDSISREMCLALAPLERGKGLVDHRLLQSFGILTPAQCESLEKGDPAWSTGNNSDEAWPLKKWCGKQLMENKRVFHKDDFGFDYEEIDLEFEQLKELEAENLAQDDVEADFESLRGATVSLCDQYVGKPAPTLTEDIIKNKLLKEQNMWKINHRFRGAVYSYLQKQAKEVLLHIVRVKAKTYYVNVPKFRAGGWEQDQIILRQQKFIGVTTTGLGKYRALIAALKPKTVLIEEAAETMEAPVISACCPSLEHLILVGDHKQLRPQCAVKDLQLHPFNLNVSLFERMVNNEVEYAMLKRQRRMIPELRRLLKPIYGSSYTDHLTMKDVTVRPPVPGMGGVNSLLFSHYWPDTTDEQMSSINQKEADMIVGFFAYLILNGMTEKQITVLTFYNGQRKLLLRKLKSHPNLNNRIFKVVTIDSYQGEENDVVLLSLVRSNNDGKIGFLGVENRICVALSRAKRGFYLFGNGELLAGESKLWASVITILAGKKKGEDAPVEPKCRIAFAFPVVCTNHGRKTYIKGEFESKSDSMMQANFDFADGGDWASIYGGCERKCHETLRCGHKCLLTCHPFDHDDIACQEPCIRPTPCGHSCKAVCSEQCICPLCGIKYDRSDGLDGNVGSHVSPRDADIEAWNAYSNGGVKQDDVALKQKLDELDLAAAVQSAHGHHDLRDKYLLEQAVNIRTTENVDIEAARSNPAFICALPGSAPLGSLSSNIVTESQPNSMSLNTSSGSRPVSSWEQSFSRIVNKGMFSIHKGFIPHVSAIGNPTKQSPVETSPAKKATAKVLMKSGKAVPKCELLIDLD
jgi:helicase required for RNAi-mediated heterochromatin assembly 1